MKELGRSRRSQLEFHRLAGGDALEPRAQRRPAFGDNAARPTVDKGTFNATAITLSERP
jgi:hypothetical protein